MVKKANINIFGLISVIIILAVLYWMFSSGFFKDPIGAVNSLVAMFK